MRLVGRRVKIIKSQDGSGVLGKRGTIVESDGRGMICIQIDNWDQGHGGKAADGSRNKWYFGRRAVRLLGKKKKTKKRK